MMSGNRHASSRVVVAMGMGIWTAFALIGIGAVVLLWKRLDAA
jgi:hypothetical protein